MTTEVHQFETWITDLVDEAGDTPTAVERLKLLTKLKTAIELGITELEVSIGEWEGAGPIDTPHGAVTVRIGPERYEYAKADSDEAQRFLELVMYRVIDEAEQDEESDDSVEMRVAKQMAALFPATARSARVGAMKDLGLDIRDWRTPKGRKTSVQIH